MALNVRQAKKRSIEVLGISGSFHVGPDTGRSEFVKLRYFNTVASGKDNEAAGHSRALLEELKPMRERVKVSDLKDLSSLLQRELDDQRVAQDLVPYLQGKKSTVGFFPGILVALVPKGFLQNNENASYPVSKGSQKTEGEIIEEFGECWTLTRYNNTSLGNLEIDPTKADLIVLDGQHRANAFRYITGTFAAANGTDNIYSAFYNDADDGASFEFDSELPVTILWFESSGKLDPKLVSRQLFVDVNTNAKAVSASRNILLDDRKSSSICVISLYRKLATRGFDTNAFTLLHAGFDCEENEQHKLVLFLPVYFDYAFSYFALGKDEYDHLDNKITRDSYAIQRNYQRIATIVNGIDPLFPKAEKGDQESSAKLYELLDTKFNPIVLDLITGFCLVDAHIRATNLISNWVEDRGSEIRETWQKVFCGGEGLYGAFKRASDSGRAKTYKNTITEIENEFIKKRTEMFDKEVQADVHKAYITFTSKASLTGYLMAAQYYCKKSGTGWDARSGFVSAANKISKDKWINIFAVYKPTVINALEPKLWIVMRNIILRVIQGVEPEFIAFQKSEMEDFNPDSSILRSEMFQSYQAFKRQLAEQDKTPARPNNAKVLAWCNQSISSLKNTLELCGLKPIVGEEEMIKYCQKHLESIIPNKDNKGTMIRVAEHLSDEDEDEFADVE